MAITGTPTTTGDDTVTITPTGAYSVDAQAGTDTLVLDFSSLGSDIAHSYWGSGYYRYSDDVATSVNYLGFERYDLTMGDGDDVLVGGSLNDRLTGNNGNDLFYGGIGADTIEGGSGHDRWSVDYSGVNTAVALTLRNSGLATIAATGATLSSIEAISLTTGLGNDVINTSAYAGNDNIATGEGDDTLFSGRGIDTVNGGGGEDLMRLDWSAVTDPNANIANSYVGSGWYRYSNGTDRVDYLGMDRFDLTGGAGSDTLYGGSLDDTLEGNGGNDVLVGYGGTDVVHGGDGLDTWHVDTTVRNALTQLDLNAQTTGFGAAISGIEAINYTGGTSVDRIVAQAGAYNDVIATGDGNDQVTTGRGVDRADGGLGSLDRLVMDWSSITDPRHAIVSSYVGSGWYRYASGSGDQLDYLNFETYHLRGGAGDDWLGGGALNDTLYGNAGDDTLSSSTGDGVIDGGLGTDTWVADLSAQGSALFDAVASQTTAQVTGLDMSVSGIERLSLTTGNKGDVISTDGFALNDTISTSGGNDVVNGGMGHDWLDGGVGKDVLRLNYDSAQTNVYNSYYGSGWNRYQQADGTSSATWINFERFFLTGGIGHDTLVGGALGDTLAGNDGNDWLNGVAGNDSIAGGKGLDVYEGNYSAFGSAMSLTLSANGGGTLIGPGTRLSGIESIYLTTGALDDTINLSALTGSDTLYTGEGNDVIDIGRGLTETVHAGGGTDVLTLDASLSSAGLRMWYYGSGWTRLQATNGSYTADMAGVDQVAITGSASSDRFYGFDMADTLNGGAGVDFLDGGKGNDLLIGGAGADLFVFSDLWNAGRDTILDPTAGDRLRMSGFGLNGAVMAGDGSAATTGQVYIDGAGGVSTLHIGLDGTAGADLHIDLTGSFAPGNFVIAGTDLLIL